VEHLELKKLALENKMDRKFTIQNDETGYSFTLSGERPPTDQEIVEIVQQRQQQSLTNLAFNKRKIVRYETPKAPQTGLGGISISTKREPIYEDERVFLEREVANALLVPKDKIDFENAAPFVLRADLGRLHQLGDKQFVLQQKYGADNVFAFNLGGKITFMFRENPKDKWKFVDGRSRLEVADFTADIAGEILPNVAGIVAGAVMFSSGIGAPGSAATAAGAQFAVGTAQDVLLTKLTGYGPGVGDTLKRRSVESAIGFGVDLATMKAGRVVLGMFRTVPEGGQLLKDLADVSKPLDLPSFLIKSEKDFLRAADIANKYDNSAVADFFKGVRSKIGLAVEERVGLSFTPPRESRFYLRTKFDEIARKFQADMSKISNTIESMEFDEAALKQQIEGMGTESARSVTRKAQQAYQEELQSRIQKLNLGIKPMQSVEDTVNSVQRELAANFLRKHNQKTKLYQNAYDQLGDVNTSADRLGEIFGKFEGEAILDVKNEAMSLVNTPALRQSGVIAENMFDVPGTPVSFQQLNTLIQTIEEKTKRGVFAPGVSAGDYRRIADALRDERQTLLNAAPKPAQETFELANRYFQNEYLPMTEGVYGNAIKVRAGQSLFDAVDRKTGEILDEKLREIVFYKGGQSILTGIMEGGKSVNDILRMTNNNPRVRESLRTSFLQGNGLIEGQPMSKLSFSPNDYDVIRALWGNDRVTSFKGIQSFVNSADDFKYNFTEEFNKSLGTIGQTERNQLLTLGRNKAREQARLKELEANVFVNLFNSGDIPLPDSPVVFSNLAEKLIDLKPADFNRFVSVIDQSGNKTTRAHLENAVLYDLIRKAGNKQDAAQIGSNGYQLWDAESMGKLLNPSGKRRSNLNALFGRERIDTLDSFNRALQRFSVERPPRITDTRVGTTANQNGMAVFFSNVYGSAKDRIAAASLSFSLNSDAFKNKFVPVLRQQTMSPEAFNDALLSIHKATFMSSRGIQALHYQAEMDPEFADFITSQYADLMQAGQAGEQ
jgi:hypothetical protein